MPKMGMEPLRRAEAINAALECFCIYGIEKTTLDMVAEQAGFSKGVVAYYFKSKKQLISDSLKAFLKAYKIKTSSQITDQMTPVEMLRSVVEVSLPPMNEEKEEFLNVSDLEGAKPISLPEKKIAKLFSQYIARAALDDELRETMREVYTQDVAGIAEIISYGKKYYHIREFDEELTAYTLLTLIYGLSFFRITGFLISGKEDNRAAALRYIDALFS